MKPAFAKDEALLADVRRVLAAGERGVWWLGQSGFLVTQKGRALILDPYLSDSLTRKYADTPKPHVRMTERAVDPAALGRLGVIDVITSSHQHTDHFDVETLLVAVGRRPLTDNLGLEGTGVELDGSRIAGLCHSDSRFRHRTPWHGVRPAIG